MSRDCQAFRVLPWAVLLALLLGLVLSTGASAQEATPIATEPDQAPASRFQIAASQDELLQAETPTGTVTRTASNLTPSQGELLTFTSTISGNAPANTTFYLFNITPNTQLQYEHFRVVSSSNLTLDYSSDIEVLTTVHAAGHYSATYQWDMIVLSPPGTVIDTASEFQDQNQHFNENVPVSLTVTDDAFTGTIAVTPSNPLPAAGSLVTLSIAISGTGPANATLAVDTSFTATQLAVEAFRTVSSTNLGTLGHLAEPGTNLITGTLQSGGAYSATFEVDVRVASSLANGTGISILSNLGEIDGSSVGSTTTMLTVTAMPEEPEPAPTETATPGEPEPTATVPPATSVPVTPETPAKPDSSSGQGTSDSSVTALPATGNGSGPQADVVLVGLLGAGVLAAIAAVVVGRRSAGHR